MPDPLLVKLDTPPRNTKTADPYIWADYIELLCLVDVDRRISKADILRRIGESEDLGDVEEVAPDPDSELVPDEFNDPDRELDFYSGDLIEPTMEPPEEMPAERDTANERQVDRWFEHLEYRSRSFGDYYPFVVNRGILSCKEGIKDQPKCRLYIFLLLSSCLKYINKQMQDEFTSRFEIVSLIALKSYLPKQASVRLIGKHGLNRSIYNATIWQKITILSREIKEAIAARCRESDFDARDTGERGLDLVGWASFGDNAPGRLLLFGQCACGKEWDDKRFEVMNWKGFIDFTVPFNSLLFIPYCFRSAEGEWYEYFLAREALLIDRLRLLYLLRHKDRILSRLHSFDPLIDEVIEYQEPLV